MDNVIETTRNLNNEVKVLTKVIKEIENNDFVNLCEVIKTRDIIKLLMERLVILSWELENMY